MTEFEDEYPECEHEWRDGETYCDDCGTHPAAVCPECGQGVDLVFFADPREARRGDGGRDGE